MFVFICVSVYCPLLFVFVYYAVSIFVHFFIGSACEEIIMNYYYIILCMLCYITLYYIMLCYIILRYIILYYIILCYVKLYYVILYYIILYYIIFQPKYESFQNLRSSLLISKNLKSNTYCLILLTLYLKFSGSFAL